MTETTLIKKPSALDGRINRIIDTGRMTTLDAIVLGVASLFVTVPASANSGMNAPAYPDEPSTWCGRCNAPYWCAKCPTCK